jgi:hypothetical protein
LAGLGVFIEYPLDHCAGELRALIAEFQAPVFGAVSDPASRIPARGRLSFAAQAFYPAGSHGFSGIFQVFPNDPIQRLLIVGGISDINLAIAAKPPASSL